MNANENALLIVFPPNARALLKLVELILSLNFSRKLEGKKRKRFTSVSFRKICIQNWGQ